MIEMLKKFLEADEDLVLISLDQVFATVINLKEISKYLFDLKKNQHHYSEI